MKKEIIIFSIVLLAVLTFCGTVSAADNTTDSVNIQSTDGTVNSGPPPSTMEGSAPNMEILNSNNLYSSQTLTTNLGANQNRLFKPTKIKSENKKTSTPNTLVKGSSRTARLLNSTNLSSIQTTTKNFKTNQNHTLKPTRIRTDITPTTNPLSNSKPSPNIENDSSDTNGELDSNILNVELNQTLTGTDAIQQSEVQIENDPNLTIVKGSHDAAGGLDSNNVNVGPNQTMIQFHVTNPDPVNTAHNVVATFSWTGEINKYVNLAPGQSSVINLGDIAPGATKDVFYLVEFTRIAAARDTTRNYQVTIAGTDTPTYTPTGQIYVSGLTSQQSNAVTGITVSNSHPQLGDIITVTVTSATASPNVNSVVNYLVGYKPSMLQVMSMVTNYTSGGVPKTSNNVYIPNPNANAFTTTWTLKVISNDISNILGLVMDQSSNKFRYNQDYGQDIVSTYVPASVGNLVWHDLNANGRIDAGEPGIPNVLVGLYDSDGTTLLQTRTTDSNGYFYFTELYPQSYYLKFTTPTGYYISPLVYDNKANPATGMTALITLLPGQNDYNWDAGMYQKATVGNFVWNDQNADGIYLYRGAGIEGVNVTLYYANGTVAGTTTTGPGGLYYFNNLTPGNYYLRFIKPPGQGFYFSPQWPQGSGDYRNKANSNGYTQVFTLISGQTDTTQDAAMYQLGSIGNLVWVDKNANGIYDTGEEGKADVTVELYKEDGTFVSTTTTNASGYYLFSNLVPNNYYVTVTKETDWKFSPAFQGTDDEIDSDVQPTTEDPNIGKTPIINLYSGQNQLKWDAGLYQYTTISSLAWNDLNQNGMIDEGEPTLSDVVVNLYNNSNEHLASTTTNSSGIYTFANLMPGTYYLQFSKAGYLISPYFGSGYDNQANPADGKTATFTLNSGESQLNMKVGMYGIPSPLAKVGNFVWNDQNADGIYQYRGAGISGLHVYLFREGGIPAGTTTTDSSGFYYFSDIPPGNYYLQFEIPSGFIVSPQWPQGSGDYRNKADSSGKTEVFTLTAGQVDTTQDAAMYQLGSIGNFVWVDKNANGIYDTGEEGKAGVTVGLYKENGAPVGNPITTDEHGHYLFSNLVPDNYYVQVTKPDGYNFSPQFQGTDDEIDSDVDPKTGKTPLITLFSGQNQLKWDAGLYQNTTITSLVWDDLNADGRHDTGEPGISNVTVDLYDNSDVRLASTTTNSNGNYTFANLTPGTYYLHFKTPTGYYISPLAYDNKADPNTGKTSTFTLYSGESQTTMMAGMYRKASIGNWVWNDQNADGIFQGRGWGLDGVTVELYSEDGITLIDTKVTENNGFYSFSNLTPGTYIVKFTLLDGYKFSPYVPGETSITNKVHFIETGPPVKGVTDPITVVSGEIEAYIDAAMYKPVAVGSLVWTDLNFDGILDPGEPGLPGIRVELYNGLTNEYLTYTTTDEGGNYSFNNLKPDFYYVKFIKPDGYTFSPQYAVEDPALYSSAYPVDGTTVSREYTSGTEYMYVNAGMYGTADVSLTKTSSNSRPNVGQEFYYTISLTNSGPNDATNVKVYDDIPTDLLAFNSYEASQGSYSDGVWNVGTLETDTNATIKIYVTPKVAAAGQTIDNTATETQTEYDPTPATDTSEIYVPSADIGVSASFIPAACPGQAWPPLNNQIILTMIIVTNYGPDNATGVQVTDILPSTISYLDYSLSTNGGVTWTISKYLPPNTYNPSTGIWNIGDLNSGNSIILVIKGRVNATTGTVISNTATKTSENEYDPNPTNDSSTTSVTVG